MTFSIPTTVAVAVLGMLAVGFYGLMVSRNLIKVIVALQVLGKSAMLALVLSGNVINQINLSQSMALTVIVADTIVAVFGLALAVQVRKKFGTLDIHCLNNLRK